MTLILNGVQEWSLDFSVSLFFMKYWTKYFFSCIIPSLAPVAQLDRVSDYGSEG